jgi:hypothetical protein
MRLSTEERRLDGVRLTAGGLTWLLVLAVPIGVGIGIHQHFPSVSALVPWLCGVVVFDLLFIFSKVIWRKLRWLLTAGKLS